MILVFDDLERSRLDTVAVLGCINEYCENQNFNTIIVANEERVALRNRQLTDALIFVGILTLGMMLFQALQTSLNSALDVEKERIRGRLCAEIGQRSVENDYEEFMSPDFREHLHFAERCINDQQAEKGFDAISMTSEWRTYIRGRLCRSRMCALRGLAAVTSECPAAFRRSAPVKGLRPLRGYRRYPYFKSTIYFCANMDYYISER